MEVGGGWGLVESDVAVLIKKRVFGRRLKLRGVSLLTAGPWPYSGLDY